MGKPKAPTPPDPYQTAAAQAGANRETALLEAKLNRYNTTGPGGSVTWSQDPNDPTKWAQDTQLSPEQQALYESQTKLQQGAAGEAERFFGTAPPSSDTATYQKVADALYGQATSRLDPRFQQMQSDQTAALAAQGITQGSQAHQREVDNLGRERNDAYNSAMNSAMANADAVLNNQFNRESSARGQRMNEITSILNPGAGMPQGSAQVAANVAGTPLAESIYGSYQGQQNAYNQRTGTYNSMLGGLASLGGSALRFSDRRLKKNLKRIGTHPLGLGIFTFQYLWSDDMETGVMAQDVLKVKPEAVVITPSGYYAVDYGML